MTTATDAVMPSIDAHYHHTWLIWGLFFLGQILHGLLQIDSISRQTKQTRRTILYDAWIRIAYRMGACSVLFGLVWLYPELLTKLLGVIGLQVSGDEATVIALPMNNLLALGYGMGFDSALGYIPILKSQVPPVEMPVQKVLADAAAANVQSGEAIAAAQTKVASSPPPGKDK